MVWTAALHLGAARAAADALDRVAGMIKKAVYRSSGRRVRGDDDKIPAIKTAGADLPLDVLRNMDKRVDPWSATPCAPTNALRMFAAHAHTCTPYVKSAQEPRTRQNEWHTRQSERRSELRGVGPVPPATGSPRALAYAAPTSAPTRAAGSRTAQRSPSTGTIGTSRRRTESPSWLEMQALTATNPLTP